MWQFDQECARYWPNYDEEILSDCNVCITLGNVEEVCEHVVSYQLFVSPLDILGELGEEHEVTLIHYTGWRAFVPRNGDEMTGYAQIIKRIVRFYLDNRASGYKALIHCK